MWLAAALILLPACGQEGDPGACAPSAELRVVAEGTDFDTGCLAAPAGVDVTIEFENRDEGVRHNIVIRTDGRNLFEGKILQGPAKATYRVEPLPAGEHRFFCFVHPFQMLGRFVVE